MGAALRAMGHDVSPTDGGTVGGYQAIMFTPDSNESAPAMEKGSGMPINGFYRAGSDHRKDGGAVGW